MFAGSGVPASIVIGAWMYIGSLALQPATAASSKNLRMT
jgi:hypothetical protein